MADADRPEGQAPRPPRATMLMGALAAEHPELASFAADATLMEIKVMYGVNTFAEVRELGRRRSAARALQDQGGREQARRLSTREPLPATPPLGI